MEKFDIIPGSDPKSGLIDVMHIESPRCHILISDLHINNANEGDTASPAKIYEFADADAHYYCAEIMIVETFESGDYNRLMADCWKWWLEMQISRREMERFLDD